MEKLCIEGGRPLRGRIRISGAKNSAVALIPAALMAESPVIIDQLPQISDVEVYIQLLQSLNATVEHKGNALHIDPTRLTPIHLPNGKVKKLRASYYLMGASLRASGKRSSACRRL